MANTCETVLSTIDGSVETERLVLVHIRRVGESHLELRQQSWGEGIGWFTQSSLPLAPHQVGQLRNALGSSSGKVSAPISQPQATRRADSTRPTLRIAHAESA